jgi:hypothetical protein
MQSCVTQFVVTDVWLENSTFETSQASINQQHRAAFQKKPMWSRQTWHSRCLLSRKYMFWYTMLLTLQIFWDWYKCRGMIFLRFYVCRGGREWWLYCLVTITQARSEVTVWMSLDRENMSPHQHRCWQARCVVTTGALQTPNIGKHHYKGVHQKLASAKTSIRVQEYTATMWHLRTPGHKSIQRLAAAYDIITGYSEKVVPANTRSHGRPKHVAFSYTST